MPRKKKPSQMDLNDAIINKLDEFNDRLKDTEGFSPTAVSIIGIVLFLTGFVMGKI